MSTYRLYYSRLRAMHKKLSARYFRAPLFFAAIRFLVMAQSPALNREFKTITLLNASLTRINRNPNFAILRRKSFISAYKLIIIV